MNDFKPEAVEQFKFFSKLFTMVQEKNQLAMCNDPKIIRRIYSENRASLTQQGVDDSKATTWLGEFFTPAGFITRLELHREHICKSKTKKN